MGIIHGRKLVALCVQGILLASMSACKFGSFLSPRASVINTQTDSFHLELTAAAETAVAGQCLRLEARRYSGNGQVARVGAAMPIALSVEGTAGFFGDSGCAQATSEATLSSDADEAVFYVRATQPQLLSVLASASEGLAASLSLPITVGAPVEVILSGATALTTADCGELGAQPVDAFGNSVALSLTLGLTSNQSGGFYSDAACLSPISSVAIAEGNQSATFYFRQRVPGTGVRIVAESTAPAIRGEHALDVQLGPAARLAFTTPAPTILNAGACGSFTVQVHDIAENPVASGAAVALDGDLDGAFYANASDCADGASPITSVTVSGNAATFYFKDTKAQSHLFVATSNSLTPAEQSVTTRPLTAGHLVLATGITGATTLKAGTPLSHTVEIRDTYGNLIPQTTALRLTLSDGLAGASAGTFTSSSCPSGMCAEIGMGQSGAAFSYVNTKAPLSPTLTVTPPSGSGMSSLSLPISIIAGDYHHFVIAGPPSVTAKVCRAYTTTLKDIFGNDARFPTNGAYNLSFSESASVGGTNPTATVFSDSKCTVSYVGNTALTGGASTTTFYYKPAAVTTATTRYLSVGHGYFSPGSPSIPDYAVTVNPAPTISSISTNAILGCAVVNGAALCWGQDPFLHVNSKVPTAVTGFTSGVEKIGLGSNGSCAVVSGAVKCWGQTFGAGGPPYPVTAIAGLNSGIVDVQVGEAFNCALTNAGVVKCWGDGSEGSYATTPQEVATGIASLSVGASHACGITTATPAGLVCWGQNYIGQIAAPTPDFYSSPVTVAGFTSVVTVVAGGNHTCASDGRDIKCWGYNQYGQLGSTVDGSTSVPTVGTTLAGSPKLSAQNSATCAINQGDVYCWGAGAGGLAADPAESGPTAVKASGVSNATQLTGRCLVDDSGVKCWGRNDQGQLGDGTNVDSATPVGVQF